MSIATTSRACIPGACVFFRLHALQPDRFHPMTNANAKALSKKNPVAGNRQRDPDRVALVCVKRYSIIEHVVRRVEVLLQPDYRLRTAARRERPCRCRVQRGLHRRRRRARDSSRSGCRRSLLGDSLLRRRSLLGRSGGLLRSSLLGRCSLFSGSLLGGRSLFSSSLFRRRSLLRCSLLGRCCLLRCGLLRRCAFFAATFFTAAFFAAPSWPVPSSPRPSSLRLSSLRLSWLQPSWPVQLSSLQPS